MRIKPKIKHSPFRSEIKMVKGKSKANYLVIRFKDDKNNYSEYHVFAEVQALNAASDIGQKLGKTFKSSMNSRRRWNIIWKEL
ncbi:MAG: hypothetical protein SGI96_20225 [Bacteroidota bacterium]|nr:hypothetical protein [Bacteroidota bacterium]